MAIGLYETPKTQTRFGLGAPKAGLDDNYPIALALFYQTNVRAMLMSHRALLLLTTKQVLGGVVLLVARLVRSSRKLFSGGIKRRSFLTS